VLALSSSIIVRNGHRSGGFI